MKKCKSCGIVKPLSEFYCSKGNTDGKTGKCKDCIKEYSAKHRKNNPEYYRQYERSRSKSIKRIKARKDYQEKFKENDPEGYKRMRRESVNKYRENNREKYIAHSRFGYAYRTGKIKKKPCEICGDPNTEAHHPDYGKPLEVVWLCDYHHKEEHKRIKRDRNDKNN